MFFSTGFKVRVLLDRVKDQGSEFYTGFRIRFLLDLDGYGFYNTGI